MIQRHPTFLVSSLNIHRLLITALMLAAKFCEDTYVAAVAVGVVVDG
jgi:hypothetical protein